MKFDLLLQVSQLRWIEKISTNCSFLGAFNGANSLRYLNLDYNDLTTIQEGTFADLTKLYFIDIEYNPLQEIKRGKTSLKDSF